MLFLHSDWLPRGKNWKFPHQLKLTSLIGTRSLLSLAKAIISFVHIERMKKNVTPDLGVTRSPCQEECAMGETVASLKNRTGHRCVL
jgi:hypothetical protein